MDMLPATRKKPSCNCSLNGHLIGQLVLNCHLLHVAYGSLNPRTDRQNSRLFPNRDLFCSSSQFIETDIK